MQSMQSRFEAIYNSWNHLLMNGIFFLCMKETMKKRVSEKKNESKS